MTKTQIKTLAVQAVATITNAGGKINKYALQCQMGFGEDDATFEQILGAAGRRIIRVRGQGGGLYAA